VPRRFLDHAARDELLTTLRLTPPDIARDVLTALGATP
jgi:1-deoxy-D-xylulose-5-phosphate synthase